MRFCVGPYDYSVRVVAGYIVHEGENCLGLCDNEKHEILISDQASPAQQIQVACHEYMEAWVYHFGANLVDKEDYCDLFGLAMTQFLMDFMRDIQPVLKPQAAANVESFLREQLKLSPALPAENTAELTTPQHTSNQPTSPITTMPADKPFRVTRIYEPPAAGSSEPWMLRVLSPE